MFVIECVKFYSKCWKERCELVADDTSKKETLLEEVRKILEQYENTDRIGIKTYLRSMPSNMSVRTNDYIFPSGYKDSIIFGEICQNLTPEISDIFLRHK